MLYILSGRFKGHRLLTPKTGTRPTTALVKKALFDMLRPTLEGSVFCDLFSGSGAIALEALSQGASTSYLIEAHKPAFICLKKNVELLKCSDTCHLYLQPAIEFLKKHNLSSIDLFFLDPPYDIKPTDPSSYEALLRFFSQASLKEKALIICETKDDKRIETALETLTTLHIITKRHYGATFLYFIQQT
jgi:16S rRNA (guanine966-N2)-methyltransferase